MLGVTQGKRFEFDNRFAEDPLMLDGIRLFQFGELYCEAGYEVPPHRQWCLEISYIIAGQGDFLFDGRRYPVQEGDLLITPLNASHAIKTQEGQALRFAYMGFALDDALGESARELRAFYENPPVPHRKGDPGVMMAFVNCLEEFYQPSEHSRMMIGSYVRQIIVRTYRICRDAAAPGDARPGVVRVSGQAVYGAIRYIDKHLYHLPDIRMLAKELGYSPYYLSHVFKERTGSTIARYIAQKKMEKACELLRQANLPVGQVAKILGYSGAQAFSAAFKRVMGEPPSVWLQRQ